MSGFAKINLAVQRSWQSTTQLICQHLARVKFVVEDTFSFGDFDPQVDYAGMATSAVAINRARYLKIWKFLWVSIDFRVILGAPFTNYMGIILPASSTAAGTTAETQRFGCGVQNGGVDDVGFAFIGGGTNEVFFLRAASAAFTIGQARVSANFFLEVM